MRMSHCEKHNMPYIKQCVECAAEAPKIGFVAPEPPPKYVKNDDLKSYRESRMPEFCPILGHPDIKAVVDHDHKSGKVRGVISNEGNLLIGKLENYFRSRCSVSNLSIIEVLDNIREHLNKEQVTYHPIGLRVLTKKFFGRKAEDQISILEEMGVTQNELDTATNKRKRANLYRKKLIG